MDELKRCPFCGGYAEVKTRYVGKPHDTEREIPSGYYVQCQNCFAETMFFSTKNQERFGGAKVALSYAIEAWNGRANE